MRRFLAVPAVATVLVLSAGGPATADPPFAVTEQVTDRARAMSPDNVPRVTDAIAELESEDQVRLFIVYVEVFGSLAYTGIGLIVGGALLIALTLVWAKIIRRGKPA